MTTLTKFWQHFKAVFPFAMKLWLMLLLTYITVKIFSDDVLAKVVNIDIVTVVLAVIAIIAPIVKGMVAKKQK